MFAATERFTAGRITDSATGDSVPFKISGTGPREGEAVVLTGTMADNPPYGRQLAVKSWSYNSNIDDIGLTKFLAGDSRFAGIGPSRAASIVEFCAGRFAEIINSDPRALTAVRGITPEIADTIASVWTERLDENNARAKLAGLELTQNQIGKLIAKYGPGAALDVVFKHPFALIADLDGFGFKRADTIARKAGIKKNDTARIEAGLLNTLAEARDAGHTYITKRDLIETTNELLTMDDLNARSRITTCAVALIERGEIYADAEGRVALNYLHLREMKILETLRGFRVLGSSDGITAPPDLNDKQREAFRAAFSSSISVISGGAGTGKTYTIRAICDECDICGLSVALCAPTGRAAKRMTESTGRPAQTIHRLLAHNGTEFTVTALNPLKIDMLIVDEISMMDIDLCYRLFDAIDFAKTTVIMVGDHNQLPPVGPGSVLRDIIARDIAPTTILTDVVRQAGALKINSCAILRGEVARKNAKREWYVLADTEIRNTFGFQRSQRLTPTDYANYIFALYRGDTLADRLNFDLIRDVQLVTPTHNGELGTGALNAELQKIIQKKINGVDVPAVGPKRRLPLLVGDKVMQHKNNYKLGTSGIMNGAVGYVRDIVLRDGKKIHVIEWDGFNGDREITECDGEAMSSIFAAYACTIHKMQGSEIPCVIAVIHKNHNFMSHRNLFYTAVTRAQKCAIIIGDTWGIRNCAEKIGVDKRNTWMGIA